jgi:hypothetical protein
MRVFWLFVCLQASIFSLAFLGDLVWKRRMKADLCQSCARGNPAQEVFGFWIHQYREGWMPCSAKKQKNMTTAEIEGIAARKPGGHSPFSLAT